MHLEVDTGEEEVEEDQDIGMEEDAEEDTKEIMIMHMEMRQGEPALCATGKGICREIVLPF